jgi:hypothetical protein
VTRTSKRGTAHAVGFLEACSLLEAILAGDRRKAIVAELPKKPDLRAALVRLRESMRSHVWRIGSGKVSLAGSVADYDAATRREGFHALHDWDGVADRVNEEIIPVDVLDYIVAQRGGDAANAVVPAILLDYYLVHLLGLLSLRAWDEGDATANLERLDALLAQLHGPGGSGQRFVADAETLLLVATSHYELQETGYDRLLARVRTLAWPRQVRVARGHAASIGCHLRFGFEATYARDTVNMRNDNVADYPWLCFAVATLMHEYARLRGEPAGPAARDAIVEALLNGLSPDARAFVGGHPPASLSGCEAERAGFRELFLRHREELIPQFERHRPAGQAYSPLSFFFNFSHNVLKGAVVDALLWDQPWAITLNDLLTGITTGPPDGETKEALATTLMGYARANPHRIRGRPTPVIVYDPRVGRQAFSVAMRKIRE